MEIFTAAKNAGEFTIVFFCIGLADGFIKQERKKIILHQRENDGVKRQINMCVLYSAANCLLL